MVLCTNTITFLVLERSFLLSLRKIKKNISNYTIFQILHDEVRREDTDVCHDPISIPTHEEGDVRKHPLYPSWVKEVFLALNMSHQQFDQCKRKKTYSGDIPLRCSTKVDYIN